MAGLLWAATIGTLYCALIITAAVLIFAITHWFDGTGTIRCASPCGLFMG